MMSRTSKFIAVLLSVPLLVLIAAWLMQMMGHADGHSVDLDAILAGMSAAHPLGTDALGRDLLARLAEVCASLSLLVLSWYVWAV